MDEFAPLTPPPRRDTLWLRFETSAALSASPETEPVTADEAWSYRAILKFNMFVAGNLKESLCVLHVNKLHYPCTQVLLWNVASPTADKLLGCWAYCIHDACLKRSAQPSLAPLISEEQLEHKSHLSPNSSFSECNTSKGGTHTHTEASSAFLQTPFWLTSKPTSSQN